MQKMQLKNIQTKQKQQQKNARVCVVRAMEN